MATEYKWIIYRLECYPEYESILDVVFTIYWRRQATNGTYTADIYGDQTIQFNSKAPFTPYADLTEAEIIGWLENALGPETLTAQIITLDKQLENLINPPIISPPLPWLPPTT